MAYKKGDKIIVRGEDWYNRHAHPGHDSFALSGVFFTSSMKRYLGQIGVIENLYKEKGHNRYRISFNGTTSGFVFAEDFIRKYHEPQVKQISDGKNHFDKRNFVLELDYNETKMLIGMATVYKAIANVGDLTDGFRDFLCKLDDIRIALRE